MNLIYRKTNPIRFIAIDIAARNPFGLIRPVSLRADHVRISRDVALIRVLINLSIRRNYNMIIYDNAITNVIKDNYFLIRQILILCEKIRVPVT